MLRSIQYFTLILMCLTLAACQGSNEPKKYSVSGTVTLDGKPLDDNGIIYFKTIETGDVSAIDIVNGQFKGTATPGPRRIEIVAYHETIQDLGGMKGPLRVAIIPPQYNSESTLTETVKSDGPNQFKFDLTSK